MSLSKRIVMTTLLLALFVLGSTLAFAQEDPINLGENAVKGKKIGFIQLTLGVTYHATMSDRFEELGKIYEADVAMVVSPNRSAEERINPG